MLFLKVPYTSPLVSLTCERFVAEAGWRHSKRRLDSFILIMGLQGSIFIQQDDQQYEVGPGQVLLLMPGHLHFGYKPSEAGAAYYWCQFHSRGSCDIVDQAELLQSLSRHVAGNRNNCIYLPVFFTLASQDRVTVLFRQLAQTHFYSEYAQFQTGLGLASIAAEITEDVFHHYSQVYNNTEKSKFNEALEWVRINFNKPLLVTAVARQFNYNPNYFSRLFKEKTSLPMLKYVNQLRLDRARLLLVDTSLGIKEIASQVGIADEKHFMKLFRQAENMTPTQYRKVYSFSQMSSL